MTLLQFNISLLSFLLFTNTLTYTQNKPELIINGNREFSDDYYASLINKSHDEGFIKKQIEKALQDQGYFSFKIKGIESDTLSNKISIDLDEGEKTYIHSITIDSLTRVDTQIVLSEIEPLIQTPLVTGNIEKAFQSILTEYENYGYPFAEISINSIVFIEDSNDKSLADIYLRFNKKKKARIDVVEIRGNEKTKKNVILNATGIYEGMTYNQQIIDDIPLHLNKLRFFKKIAKPNFFIMNEDRGVLQISVEEKNTNTFDGILGYVPSQGRNSESYLTGYVNIGLRNLFGTGRAFAIKWQRETSETQELELKYLEPWIFNYPISVQLNLFQRQQDTLFVKRIIGGEITYLATNNISATLLMELESVIPSSSNDLTSVLTSNSLNSGIEFELDYRDDIYSPTRGIYFDSKYIYRSKSIKNNSSISTLNFENLEYHNYEFNFGAYKTIFENQVIALKIAGKEIIGNYYDESDYFYFGGTNSVRGYREKQFLGNRLAWGNLEYRFLLSPVSYLFGFYDLGYYLMEIKGTSINKISSTISGYGFGISLETGLGILKVSYAIPKGGSISSGLIHFGLINEF